jgi:hypothetical protein
MTVAIIGAGVMGEALLSGLIRGGHEPAELMVGEKRAERATELRERYAVRVVANTEAAAGAETVALVVKPQDMGEVLTEIAPHLRAGQLVISLAAGITTDYIEKHIPDGIAVVRVMPNTPALVDEGMAAISGGTHCDEEHLAYAEQMLAVTGRVVRVPEKQQDAVTAISGSGPAYRRWWGRPSCCARPVSTRRCSASGSPRRAAPRRRRSASSRTTRSGLRSSRPWRLHATGRSPSPPAMTDPGVTRDRVPAWQAGLVVAVLTLLYAAISIQQYRRMDSYVFDLGFFESVIRDYAHGHLPELPLTDSTEAALHFSPALALLVPFVLIAPSPLTVLCVQALVVAAGVVPLMRAAKPGARP